MNIGAYRGWRNQGAPTHPPMLELKARCQMWVLEIELQSFSLQEQYGILIIEPSLQDLPYFFRQCSSLAWSSPAS